jgi:hypothetical protein
MSNKTKKIIAAVIALLGTAFGWYVAFSDGNPATVPNSSGVIAAGNDVVNALRASDDATNATGNVEAKIATE